jgi:hypothetical protein
LSKSKELENLSDLGVNSLGTSDSDNDGQFRLRFNVEVASLLGLSSQSDGVLLQSSVLLNVLLSSLEDDPSILSSFLISRRKKKKKEDEHLQFELKRKKGKNSTNLDEGESLLFSLDLNLSVSLSLLQQSFRNGRDLRLGSGGGSSSGFAIEPKR